MFETLLHVSHLPDDVLFVCSVLFTAHLEEDSEGKVQIVYEGER